MADLNENKTIEQKEKVDYSDSLPCKFLDEQLKEKIIDEVEEAELPLNENIKFLNDSGIKCETVEDVLKVSADGVHKYINEECNKFLKASSFIPKNVQMETRVKYYNAFKEIEPSAMEVERIVGKYKDIKIVLGEDNRFHFDEDSLNAYAEEKATTRTDKEQREAYRAYKKLYNAFIECNEWEKAHNWVETSINGVSDYCNGQLINVSIWNILSGARYGLEPTPLTPERFLHICKFFCGKKRVNPYA